MVTWCSVADLTLYKMKFSIEDFFSECDQIRSKLRTWPYLLKKSLTENFIFCAMSSVFHLMEIQKISLPVFIRKAFVLLVLWNGEWHLDSFPWFNEGGG